MPEKPIGKVTHYYSKLSVASLELSEPLRVGDTVHIKGYTSDLTQRIESMQIEHENVTEAKPGDSVAIKVADHVREHDVVYKVE